MILCLDTSTVIDLIRGRWQKGLPLIDWGVSPELLTPAEIAVRVAEGDRDL